MFFFPVPYIYIRFDIFSEITSKIRWEVNATHIVCEVDVTVHRQHRPLICNIIRWPPESGVAKITNNYTTNTWELRTLHRAAVSKSNVLLMMAARSQAKDELEEISVYINTYTIIHIQTRTLIQIVNWMWWSCRGYGGYRFCTHILGLAIRRAMYLYIDQVRVDRNFISNND